MRKINQLMMAGVIGGLLASTSAVAEDDEDGFFALGLGVGYGSSIYVGGDDEATLLPVVLAQYGRFYIDGESIGVELYEFNDVYFYGSLGLDRWSDDRDDSDRLKDMRSLDTAAMLRLGAAWETSWGELDFSVAQDVANAHDGTEVALSFAKEYRFGNWSIEPYVETAWVSDKVADYYFGVTATDARANRRQYTADSAWLYGLGVFAEYPLGDTASLFSGVGMEFYSSDITDSPIVDEKKSFEAFMGVAYSF